MGNSRIDQISGFDFSRALIKAAEKLSTSKQLPGKALFVTKGKDEETPVTKSLVLYMGKQLGYPSIHIPDWVIIKLLYRFAMLLIAFSKPFILLGWKQEPAVPLTTLIKTPFVEMTFDNSLAREILDFQPVDTWKQACDRVLRQWKDSK